MRNKVKGSEIYTPFGDYYLTPSGNAYIHSSLTGKNKRVSRSEYDRYRAEYSVPPDTDICDIVLLFKDNIRLTLRDVTEIVTSGSTTLIFHRLAEEDVVVRVGLVDTFTIIGHRKRQE